MEAFIQDLKYGSRMLVKSPAFTLVAVLALALGMGANTAIFSVVNAVLVRSLPFRDPDRLVMVWENNRNRGRDQNVISPANYQDWREQNSVFESMAAFFDARMNLTGVDDPEEVATQLVEANFFDVLGVSAALGRTFVPEEGQLGNNQVVVLSNALWKRRFGGDPTLTGKTIKLNGRDNTVVGIAPAGFQLLVRAGSQTGNQAELWTPLVFSESSRVRRGRSMMAIARLKPGVTHAQAQTEMDGLGARLEQQYADFNTGWGINLVPLQKQLVGAIRPALLVLLGAVAFVLLIACANVANLLLARAATRQREMAIRTALGARRGRIIRQLLTEATVLAVLGGALGFGLAIWGTDLLLALAPRDLTGLKDVSIEYRVFGFTIAVSVLTGVLFGLAPALEASRPNLNESLKEGGRGVATGARSHRWRSAFVVAEVALALVLLIGAGLMIRSFARLNSVDPGFDSNKLLSVRVQLPASKYAENPQRIAFFKQLSDRVQAIPGVRSAGAISFLPFTGGGAATSVVIEGQPIPPPGQRLTGDVRVVDGGYFQTMGIPLVRGRTFTERELTQESHVVVINEAMARDFFPGEDPIGKRVTIAMKEQNLPSEIIGVVRDVRHVGLETPARAMTYWPYPELVYTGMTLIVRSEGEPLALADAIRHEVLALDKDQPIADISTMEQLLSVSTSRARFSATLLGVFAGVALLLAAVGIFGVMSYGVSERTHELGVRMALGAPSSSVLLLVVRQGMVLTVTGIAIGLAAAVGLTRVMSSLLYGISPTDLTTFAAISVLLGLVALVACYLPARRATKVDPMIALRYE